MPQKIKSILFVIGVVMVFTAQVNRPDKNDRQQVPAARLQVQTRKEEAPHNNQGSAHAVARREGAPQIIHKESPAGRPHEAQPLHQEGGRQRVYAVSAPAPVENNRLFHRQHHKNWQPRYNFYNNQYHFYPYVNIASVVELSGDCISVAFDGQAYSYDEGTFYLQDAQGQYVAVAPPIGIVVNAIPADARQINVDNQVYYRYKGVFYIQVATGYQVVEPLELPSEDS